tara:strand:+ start:217 stop:411 length:195 start_codon:yes stop_codon:yes gene_type:complete
MKILKLNFSKLHEVLSKDTLQTANEFEKFDEKRKIDLISECIYTESTKDQPQSFYSNQIIIEQL